MNDNRSGNGEQVFAIASDGSNVLPNAPLNERVKAKKLHCNKEINNYFSIDENSNLVIRVGGVDISTTSVYKYSVMIKNQEKGIDYYEILSDTKEDIENEEREER